MNQELLQNFTDTANFSKKNALKRLLLRPCYTIYKISFSKIYNIFLKNKPISISGKTFWGDTMKMFLPEDSSLFHWGIVPGEEEDLTEYMIKTIQEGWTVIDIGANHGYYSLLLSKIVGNTTKVYCFEPTPSTVEILKSNTGGKGNIILEQKAVWSKNEELDFTDYGQGFSAYNSLLQNVIWKDTENSKEKKVIKVTGLPLDQYIQEKNIHPKFIKLDVEGAELEALIGMKETLVKDSPIISVEFWVNSLWNKKNDEILDFFKEINYSAFKIDKGDLKPFEFNQTKFEHDYANLIFKKSQ